MQLLTLGGLRLDATDFTRPKPILLLSYLAIEGSQSRRVLADLFFADTKDPRDSLSTAYRQLRDVDEGIILADGDRLACGIESDATRLIEALDAGLLEPAIDMYQGAFLDGLDLDLGEELEEWVFATREYLAGRVREAHWRLAEDRASSRDAHETAWHAERALDLAGAPELGPDDLPRAYRLLTAGGSPHAARVRDLAVGFGLDVEAGYDRPHAAREDGAAPTPVTNLSPPTTSFVGRDAERLEIAALLSSNHSRIITIHGPGGIGKSRLALRVARDQLQRGRLWDAVYRVDVEALTDARQIAEALATELGDATASSLDALAAAIGNRRILCIFDGFEHLADGAEALSELVASCHNLRIIVTSRERLNLAEEHVLSLRGLSIPSSATPATDARASDALQLLIQRAKKSRIDFHLTDADLPHALELCRRIDGSPLAIELAMAWIRVMPLSDIRYDIDRDLSLLASNARGIKGGHQSLRTVFERSWSLLRVREKETLCKLAVFRGGFRRHAAAEVAGATLPVLARLVDASLVSLDSDGRYRVHALIQQFSMEKLDGNAMLKQGALERFRHHFERFTHGNLEAMYTGDEPRALADLHVDLPNVMAAWDMIFESGDATGSPFPSQMVVFFDRTGLLLEGTRFFERARDALEGSTGGDEAMLRHVDANLAWLLYRQGRHMEAEYAALAALGDPLEADIATMVASNTLGLVRMDTSRTVDSIAPFERAIEISRRLEAHNREAMYTLNLARAYKTLGDFQASLDYDQRVIDIATENRYPFARALALNNLGATFETLGKYQRAANAYREALELSRGHGYLRVTTRALANLAECHWWLGDIAETRRYLSEALALDREPSEDDLECVYPHLRGRLELHDGNIEAAESHLVVALEMAQSHAHDRRHIKILPDLARAWMSMNRWAEARTALERVLEQDVPGTQSYLYAQRLIEELRSREPSERQPQSRQGPPPETVWGRTLEEDSA